MPSPPSDSTRPRTPRTWSDGDYAVTTDRARVDLALVHRFISEDSYWAQGRTLAEQARANDASTCFTVLHEATDAPVGFARVLSDDVSFGWVADVFVLEAHRGHGVGVFLMQCVVEANEHLSRLVLGTRDAHGVYAKVGFRPLGRVERWMELWYGAPNP
jgi:GNAT superfamily N-acetyltransferase